MGPIRSRAINSHFASASLTWEEKNKNLGSGLLINGCSLKPKYLTIASISIIAPIMSQYGNNASTLSRGESKWHQLLPRGVKVVATLPVRGKVAHYLFHTKTQNYKRGYKDRPSAKSTAKITSWAVTGVSEYVFELHLRILTDPEKKIGLGKLNVAQTTRAYSQARE